MFLRNSDELYDLHNDYPLAGEKIKVTEEMLTKYELQIIEGINFPLGKTKTLILAIKGNTNSALKT